MASSKPSFRWSSNLAYIVGLLVTDGCLSNDNRHIIMRSSDKDLLQTFKKCLGLDNKIGRTENKNSGVVSFRVQFGDVNFFRWLLKIGLTPAKSKIIGKIKVPDKYFKDFLRGHLDGDGNISAYKDFYNKYKERTYCNQRLFVRFISASKSHMLWLHSKIKKLVAINGAIIENKSTKPKCVSIWEIKFAKKESLKLLKWIYYGPKIPSLKRKRVVAFRAIKGLSNEKRKVYAKI